MPSVITPEELAESVCHVLGVAPRNNVESLIEVLRAALIETGRRPSRLRRRHAWRSLKRKPSGTEAWERPARSRRRSPSLHVSESGTSRCGDSGQGAAGRARGGGWAIQPTRSQTAQHGPPGRERVAIGRQTGAAGSNPGSSPATFGGGWNGGTKSLVTCTYSGGHGRWSPWSPQRSHDLRQRLFGHRGGDRRLGAAGLPACLVRRNRSVLLGAAGAPLSGRSEPWRLHDRSRPSRGRNRRSGRRDSLPVLLRRRTTRRPG